MKNSLLFLLALLVNTILLAQQDIHLRGTVVEQNSKFNTGEVVYLSNTTVKSPDASAPVMSDQKGKFDLIFVDKPVGDITRIYASKSDYELVNEEELKKATVVERKVPFKIVLCRAGQLYDNQIVYYNIAKDVAKETYDKRLAILDKEGSAREVLMAEMQVEFNQQITTVAQANELLLKQLTTAQAQAKELADKFVIINLDDQTPAYQRAFKAFLDKDTDKALAIMDSVDLVTRLAMNTAAKEKEEELIETLEESVANREEQIVQDVNQCVFKAELHILKYEFDKAEEMYELALLYDKDNVELSLEFALFLEKQNKFKKARCQYDKVLITIRKLSDINPSAYLPTLAVTLNSLGVVKSFQYDLSAATKDFEEALAIYWKLSKTNRSVYLSGLAMTLNNLGITKSDMQDFSEAKKYYEKALVIRRRLLKNNPNNAYLSNLALTLYSLGGVKFDMEDFSGATKDYEEALKIYQDLSKVNEGIYLANVGMTLNGLSKLKRTIHNFSGAFNDSEKALKIYKKLSESNPDAYLPDLAHTLNTFGNLKGIKNDFLGARKDYEEALSIFKDLAEKNANAYNLDVCMVYMNIGYLYNGQLISVDAKIKKKGLEIEKDIRSRLSIYPEENPRARRYMIYADDLSDFLETLSIPSVKIP